MTGKYPPGYERAPKRARSTPTHGLYIKKTPKMRFLARPHMRALVRRKVVTWEDRQRQHR